MTGNWTGAALITGILAIAAGAASIFILLRLQRVVLDRQRVMEDQVSTIDDAVRMIEARLAELHPAWNSSLADGESEIAAGIVDSPSGEVLESVIEPEMQAVIAAAVVAAAGPNAQVRSARLVQSADTSAWSQQGRVLVQSSHNLRR